MSEKPILFSGPMIRALLAGRKTQTRRVLPSAHPQFPHYSVLAPDQILDEGQVWYWDGVHERVGASMKLRFAPGDSLWVRETWCPANSDNGPVVLYKADHGRRYLVDESYPVDYDLFPAGKGAWAAWASDVESGSTKAYRPSIFMPRWASRITLRVTDVRAQRLQDITLGDIVQEVGAKSIYDFKPAHDGFRVWQELWDSINGTGSWDANPWVYAVSFKASAQGQIEKPQRGADASPLVETDA